MKLPVIVSILMLCSVMVVIVGSRAWTPVDGITSSKASCDHLKGQERIQCFDEIFDMYLTEKGSEAAFDYLLNIYNAYPDVPPVCHEWMHRIGEAEYNRYKGGANIELREETTYCSYGYFHGLIGAMASERGLQSGREFCEQFAYASNSKNELQFNNCIHGIGHSVATLMLESNESWGDAEKIIENGVRACEELYSDRAYLGICYDGMFHELHLALWSEDYGLTNEIRTENDDLFHYCRRLSGLPLESCVYDFVALWPYVYGDNKGKAIDALLSALSSMKEGREKPMRNLGRSFIEEDIKTRDYSGSVTACEKAQGPLFRACIEGLATGFVEHGKSGEAHKEGFSFCRTKYEGDTQNMCFEVMVEALSWSYSNAALRSACMELSSSEREKTECML